MMRTTFLLATLVSFSTLHAGAAAQLPANEEKKEIHLTFGLYQTDKATEMYRKFMPMLEAIQEGASRSMDAEVDVQLRIFRSYEEGIQALANGEVDFARFGPASYVLSKQRNPELELLAMEEKKGKTRFQGLIVVRTDSDIQTMADLAGKQFAFGDSNSTIGRYLAQEQLVNNGITAESLEGYEFLGRHDKVARAVEVGDFDAGSLKESTFKKINTSGQLRILQPFDNVTKPWIARSGMDRKTYAGLRSALLEMENQAALEAFGVTRFVATSDDQYDFVRKGMEQAKSFNKPDQLPESTQ